jgi:hypothetical protein
VLGMWNTIFTLCFLALWTEPRNGIYYQSNPLLKIVIHFRGQKNQYKFVILTANFYQQNAAVNKCKYIQNVLLKEKDPELHAHLNSLDIHPQLYMLYP